MGLWGCGHFRGLLSRRPALSDLWVVQAAQRGPGENAEVLLFFFPLPSLKKGKE